MDVTNEEEILEGIVRNIILQLLVTFAKKTLPEESAVIDKLQVLSPVLSNTPESVRRFTPMTFHNVCSELQRKNEVGDPHYQPACKLYWLT